MGKLIKIDEQFEATVLQIKNVAGMLWDKGWAEANAGNLSIDVTESCLRFHKKKNTPESVDYALQGSEKLARSTLEKIIEGFRIVIWQKHGCLAVSESPVNGFDAIDILNKGAKVLLACLNADEVPEGLSGTELTELKKAFNLSC